MAFSDPLVVTWNAVAKNLVRITTGENKSSYIIQGLTEGDLKVTISHAYGKRNRRVVRFDLSAIAADPLLTGAYAPVSASCYMVTDVPKGTYFTAATQAILMEALAGFISSGTNAEKVIVGEN